MKVILFLITFFLISLFAKPLENINLQLQWLDQFEFAGYYVAKEKGFYKEKGLSVNLLPYHEHVNYTDVVLSQDTTYAIGREDIIVDKSQGSPIVLLSALSSNQLIIS